MSEDEIMQQVAVMLLENHRLKLHNAAMRKQLEETVVVLRELQSEMQRMQTLINY
jgi:regulator of replication initiation timing